MEVIKSSFIDRGDRESTHAHIIEFPNEMIVLEGVRTDPNNETSVFTQRIMFSKEAIKEIVPALIRWLSSKGEEIMI